MSWSIINLILILYVASLGFPISMAGTVWTIIGLFRLLTQNPSGMLINRIGRKSMILVGTAIIIASYLLFFTAQDINQIFISSAVAAIGFVISAMGTSVYVADITPPGKEARYMGIFTGLMMSGGIVGPTIGTFIAELWGLQAPFIASTMVVVITLVFSFIVVKEPARVATVKTRKSTIQVYVTVFKNKFILIFILTILFTNLVEMGFGNLVLPVYGPEVVGISIVEVGLVTSIGSLVSLFARFLLVGLLERRFSRRIIILTGFLVRGITILSIIYSRSFFTLAIPFVVAALGFGVAASFETGVWIEVTTVEDRGMVYGVRNSFRDLAMTLGSTITTLLMGVSLQLPIYAIAFSAIVHGIIIFVLLAPRIFEKYRSR